MCYNIVSDGTLWKVRSRRVSVCTCMCMHLNVMHTHTKYVWLHMRYLIFGWPLILIYSQRFACNALNMRCTLDPMNAHCTGTTHILVMLFVSLFRRLACYCAIPACITWNRSQYTGISSLISQVDFAFRRHNVKRPNEKTRKQENERVENAKQSHLCSKDSTLRYVSCFMDGFLAIHALSTNLSHKSSLNIFTYFPIRMYIKCFEKYFARYSWPFSLSISRFFFSSHRPRKSPKSSLQKCYFICRN